MKRELKYSKLIVIGFSLLTLGMGLGWTGTGGASEDKSYAIEKEYSCITGGCHETNTALMTSHAIAPMTAAQVKCNACHGTHTAAEVGQPKPNLTGYVPGKGATGYLVPKDRCIACHSDVSARMQSQHCPDCHYPHEFLRRGN